MDKLIEFIADNMEVESRLLTPNPQATINVILLLDELDKINNLEEGSSGKYFNDYLDSKQLKTK